MVKIQTNTKSIKMVGSKPALKSDLFCAFWFSAVKNSDHDDYDVTSSQSIGIAILKC